MASKRVSTVPAGPKPPTSIASSAVISDAAMIVGTKQVTIGEGTVLHPRSKIDSTAGPVTIGKYCIISERVVLGVTNASGIEGEGKEDVVRAALAEGVTLEDGVNIEPGALVEAAKVGDGCAIEANTKVGMGAVLGKHSKIGPLCEVKLGEVIADHTVIYGTGQRRIDRAGAAHLKMAATKRHAEHLRRLIPSNLSKWQ